MSRFQLSLNVADVDAAVEFYSKLFGVGPAKQREGYANFVVADPPLKLVIVEGEGEPGSLNHVGVEHADVGAVGDETARITAAGLPVVVDDEHTCCFATQEKAWTRDPDGVPWELYTVTADTEHFGANPHADLDRVLPPVTLDELQSAVADPSVVVIDAQGTGGYERGHIAGSVDFGLEDVAAQAAEHLVSKDAPVVLACTDAGCIGSEFVGTQLVEAGYTNVRRFAGGVAEWQAAGLPVETAESLDAASNPS